MRNRTNTLLILLAIAFGVFFLANRYVIAKPSPADEGKRKWEYGYLGSSWRRTEDSGYKASFATSSTLAGRTDEIDSSYDGLVALNKLGADGWEIAWIIEHGSNQPEYILKRPKP